MSLGGSQVSVMEVFEYSDMAGFSGGPGRLKGSVILTSSVVQGSDLP